MQVLVLRPSTPRDYLLWPELVEMHSDRPLYRFEVTASVTDDLGRVYRGEDHGWCWPHDAKAESPSPGSGLSRVTRSPLPAPSGPPFTFEVSIADSDRPTPVADPLTQPSGSSTRTWTWRAGSTEAIAAREVEPQFRALTPAEHTLLLHLLSSEFPGSGNLLEQLSNLRVASIDNDGGLQLRPVTGAPAQVDRPIPVEGTYTDSDGVTVHVLVHVTNGHLNELEIFREDGSMPRITAIDATDFTVEQWQATAPAPVRQPAPFAEEVEQRLDNP